MMTVECPPCPEHPFENACIFAGITDHSVHEHTMPRDTSHEYEIGKHLDGGKPPLALFSTVALEDTSKVLAFGAEKYPPNNWRYGISWTSIMNSTLRHLYAFNEGEDLDKESGLSHLAHAMCDIMFLLEYTHTQIKFDDRWKGVTKTD